MSYIDERLPVDVERGASGGPRFKTSVITLKSGQEQRNQDWTNTRAVYNIGYGIQRKEDYEDVIEHFYAAKGQLNTFRFKDWSDYSIGTIGDAASRQATQAVTGSTDDFQIIKTYTLGSFTHERVVTKIVSGTLSVYDNGTLQTETTHYTVDLNTGVITFVATPTGPVEVICEFDVAVRFNTDALDVQLDLEDAGYVRGIEIVEVRLDSE